MADGYIDLPVEGGTGGILSINGSTVSAQLIVGGTGISVSSIGGTTTITNTNPGTTSPLTTKGDVWGYSTTDARIPIGTNGQVLTADSTQALGLKWATPSASGVTGTGTTNFLPIWTSSTAIGNSNWKQGTNGELQFQNFASAKGTSASPLIDLVGDGTHGAGEFTDSSFNLWFASVGKAVGSFDNSHFYIYDGAGTTNLLRISTASGNAASFLIFGATGPTAMTLANGQSPNVDFTLNVGGQAGAANFQVFGASQTSATIPGLVEFQSSFSQFQNTVRGLGVGIGKTSGRGSNNSLTVFGLNSQTVPGTWSFSGATGTGTGTLASQDLAPADIVATVSAPGTTAFISAIGSNSSITTLTNLSGSAQTLTRFPAIQGWVDHAGTVQAYLDYNGLFNLTSLTASLPVFTDANKNLTSTGIVGVAHGGTGLSTLTANNVILGNGASAPNFVAPGTSGNVLTSNGTTWVSSSLPATGVTSVALALPASVFSVSGSPVTSTGTLTGAFTTQTANTVFAGPTTGSAATPAFRALVAADLPTSFSKTTVVYQPGGTVSKNVYTSWSALWAAVNANEGVRNILFDNTFQDPIVIPAGNYTGATGVSFYGASMLQLGPIEVDLTDPTTFDDLPSLYNISLVASNASVPVITVTDTRNWFIDRSGAISNQGSIEFIKNDGGSILAYLITASAINGGNYECFNQINSASMLIYLEEVATFNSNAVRDDGTTSVLVFAASAGASVSSLQSNFTGALSISFSELSSQMLADQGYTSSPTVAAVLQTGAVGYEFVNPASGDNITIGDLTSYYGMNPSGTLATLTVKMPANPTDSQAVTISTSHTITSLTLSPNSGQTFLFTPPTTLVAGNNGVIRYRWSSNLTQWWPA